MIKQRVDAFVAAGLPEAGYEYITIDETEWPGGMKAIADCIHQKWSLT